VPPAATIRRVKHATRAISLGVVLVCVVGTMAVGTALKSHCAGGDYSDGRQYRDLCYSDIVPLLSTEQLSEGRLPFLDACRTDGDNNCDEYPVITMYTMRAAGWIARIRTAMNGFAGVDTATFYYTNAGILTVFAAATAFGIWILAGRRSLWFALAPTLLIYGTMNWDLVAVAFATLALVAFAARRDGWAGVLLGLGAASKLYPALLIIPLFLQGIQDREPDRSVRVLWWTVGTWVVVNLPFAIAAPSSWFEFFRFNSGRVADFDSLWYIACRHWDTACVSTGAINLWSTIAFLGSFGLLLLLKTARNPTFARWTLGFPLIACFLLFNKVYSPQYGLWLLPWFALAIPSWWAFVAFEVADVAVFVTRFREFFPVYDPGGPLTSQELWFEAAVLARTAVLVWCLVIWLREDGPVLALGTRGWRTAAPPTAVAA
jgi:uncharacterized membrane protein